MVNRLRRTPLYEVYKDEAGAKLIDFGGWELPVQFAAGIIEEHLRVRSNAGLFDVSHMGEILIEGPGSREYLTRLISGDVSKTAPGRCLYTILTLPDGGAVDDLVIYRLATEKFLLVVNAANTEKDFRWIKDENPDAPGRPATVSIENCSADWVQIAYQGPKAEEYLQELAEVNLADIPFYGFIEEAPITGVTAIISRTGYTGEDGFEIYLPAADGPALWRTLLTHGREKGVLPCGLGARDTLRLEARLPLYGHELTEEAGPLEAGLKSFIDFNKEYFIGRDALSRMNNGGAYRIIRGARMVDRAVPREGYRVFAGENQIGRVTSGGKSPSLNEFIALLRLPKGLVKNGEQVEIEINGKRRRAEIVPTPFWKKSYGGE